MPWYEANINVDPHAATKKKWYQANLEAARVSRQNRHWYDTNPNLIFDPHADTKQNGTKQILH